MANIRDKARADVTLLTKGTEASDVLVLDLWHQSDWFQVWPFRAAHDAAVALVKETMPDGWKTALTEAIAVEDEDLAKNYSFDKNLCRRFTEFLQVCRDIFDDLSFLCSCNIHTY